MADETMREGYGCILHPADAWMVRWPSVYGRRHGWCLVLAVAAALAPTSAIAQMIIDDTTVTAPPDLHVAGDLYVGTHGVGALTVGAGGTVTNGFGNIGSSGTGNGTVTVSGAGALWENSQELSVGISGTGTLNVGADGTVKNSYGYIGWGTTGYGTATISGAGALWQNSQELSVGNHGTGTLDVAAGGTVTNTYGYIGWGSTGNGMATVSGVGARWENSYDLHVGHDGIGALNVEAGATVTNRYGYIGSGSTGSGTATVAGVGALWENCHALNVGFSGTGALNVGAGGTVKNTYGFIGTGSTSNGTVTVAGTGALWESSLDLNVGNNGTGGLGVGAGGTVKSGDGYIGTSSTGDGLATVAGTGALWYISTGLRVGYVGTGALTIGAGGTVKSTFGNIGQAGTGNGTMTVAGAGALWQNSNILIVGVSGTGALNVGAGGTVKNKSGYIGTNSGGIGGGMVSGAGALWENSLELHVGDAGTGVLAISDGGTVRVGTSGAGAVSIADHATSTGTLVIGAAAGNPAAAPGTLDAALLNFGDGVGSLVFNHAGAAYEFSAALASTGVGTHSLDHYSGTTMLTADSSGFTGATNVNGGTLIVNGSLGSSSLITVNEGGALKGTGAVGDALISGGVFAPGSGVPGSFVTVSGDLNFNGGIYQVFVDPVTSSFARVTGVADLSGATLAISVNGPRVGQFKVLTAAGGLGGTEFASITGITNTAFLSMTDSYDADNAYLDVTKVRDFADAGQTLNQIAAGNGAESVGSGNPIHDAIVVLPTVAAARDAFDQLSGEIVASAKGMLVEDSRFVRDAANSRIRAAFGDAGSAALPVMTYGEGGLEMAAADTDRFAVWGQAFGSWGKTDGDGNAAALDRSTGGLLAGADTLVGGWRVGLLGGYSHSSFDAGNRNSSGNADSFHLGLYGGTNWGAIAFRSGAAYSWSSLSTHRSIAFNGFADGLSSDYDAGIAQVFGELAYKVDISNGFKLEPFANLAYVGVHSDDFTETGGPAALTSTGSTMDATFTTLGLRGSTELMLGNVSATARAMLGWRHAFGDTTPLSTVAFAGGEAFTIAGVPIAGDAAVIDAGIEMQMSDNATLGFSYSAEFGGSVVDQGTKIDLSLRF
ncbi:autotransporter domain-containing protein [Mesorhizobium sp. CO1-1-4]|uniref:autotransporter domain-containing protein n=1 Tax=Mesorhizobium sp. CO1-1-4 TaxID=2876633 RepID=UPI001CD035F5|nr:autotransporter domain-containing protein [Mesorhizobium sp. CO1-1-4]MBZ9739921.1 autotransporter domain-containing protein [Mesorhizobium sp. CO1-1-4]